MSEIKLEKRYPNVSTEDFCEIFSEGLFIGVKVAGENAIPIEWLEKKVDEYIELGLNSVAKELRVIIDEWEKENDTQI